jgi:hypothetical protein
MPSFIGKMICHYISCGSFIVFVSTEHNNGSSVVDCGAESRGGEIELPPGAEAEVTNCGNSSGSDSFLFTTDLKKCYKKIVVAEEIFLNCNNCNIVILLLKSKKVFFKVSYKTT